MRDFDDDPTPAGWHLCGSPSDAPESRSTDLAIVAPSKQTPGQRRRMRRDICIAICARNGVSQRLLADVFDLPRSRIAAIVAKISEKAGR